MVKFVMVIAVDEAVAVAFARVSDQLNEPPALTEPEILPLKEESDKIARIEEFLQNFMRKHEMRLEDLEAIAISSIGIVDGDSRSIARIVRPGWSKTEHRFPWSFATLRGTSSAKIAALCNTPPSGRECRYTVINDATAGAIGEFWRMKRGGDKDDLRALEGRPLVFVRVGEGINAGIVNQGIPWRGGLHPELGHLLPRLHSSDVGISYGACPIHGSCFEGLASKAGLRQRWKGERKRPLNVHQLEDIWENFTLFEPHAARDLEAYYVAQLCQATALVVAPGRIVLGGSLLDHDMCERVRTQFDALIADYPRYPELSELGFMSLAQLPRPNLAGTAHLAHGLALGYQGA